METNTVGLISAALAATAFMFQSRHHNLYLHEKDLYETWEKMKNDPSVSKKQKDGNL